MAQGLQEEFWQGEALAGGGSGGNSGGGSSSSESSGGSSGGGGSGIAERRSGRQRTTTSRMHQYESEGPHADSDDQDYSSAAQAATDIQHLFAHTSAINNRPTDNSNTDFFGSYQPSAAYDLVAKFSFSEQMQVCIELAGDMQPSKGPTSPNSWKIVPKIQSDQMVKEQKQSEATARSNEKGRFFKKKYDGWLQYTFRTLFLSDTSTRQQLIEAGFHYMKPFNKTKEWKG